MRLYFGKIETEFENILACLLGAQMGFNHEKNWRSKISLHTPFKAALIHKNGKTAFPTELKYSAGVRETTIFGP